MKETMKETIWIIWLIILVLFLLTSWDFLNLLSYQKKPVETQIVETQEKWNNSIKHVENQEKWNNSLKYLENQEKWNSSLKYLENSQKVRDVVEWAAIWYGILKHLKN